MTTQEFAVVNSVVTLRDIQASIQELIQKLDMVEFDRSAIGDQETGEHYTEVSQHLQNASGRIGTLICRVKYVGSLVNTNCPII